MLSHRLQLVRCWWYLPLPFGRLVGDDLQLLPAARAGRYAGLPPVADSPQRQPLDAAGYCSGRATAGTGS